MEYLATTDIHPAAAASLTSGLTSLDVQKLILNEMLQNNQARIRAATWRTIIAIALLAIIFLMILNMWASNREIFNFWKRGPSVPYCGISPWAVVIAIDHPWMNFLVTKPLTHNAALFIRTVILEGRAPDLRYMCGSVVEQCRNVTVCSSVWSSPEGWDPSNPASALNPFLGIIPVNSPIVSDFKGSSQSGVSDPHNLLYLAVNGMGNFAQFRDASASDNFYYLFGTVPQASSCPGRSTVASVTTLTGSAATFAMVGSVLGPPGALVGGIIGLGLGILSVFGTPAC